MTTVNDMQKAVEYQLSSGEVGLIDESDSDLLIVSWKPFYNGNKNNLYARGCVVKGKGHQSMHKVVMERIIGRKLKRSEYTDHIDGDGLNNRRKNLRLSTSSQNQANRKMNKNNKSGYRGVSYNKATQKWNAKIRIDQKLKDLGYYTTPEEAYERYKEAARLKWGEFARV